MKMTLLDLNNLENGLYVVEEQGGGPLQRALRAAFHHQFILDVSINTYTSQSEQINPCIIHMSKDGLGFTGIDQYYKTFKSFLEGLTTPTFEVAKIQKISEPSRRIDLAFAEGNKDYNPIADNCEHFVSWVVNGKKESATLQTLVSAGLVSLPFIYSILSNRSKA
ncbi:MAG: hypothetical protein GDA56_00335 [Hormoscilla sp. GM7CHS1pb]|nr:hypothetical protein [Hormoscilla sp. GM7CHS1pb]